MNLLTDMLSFSFGKYPGVKAPDLGRGRHVYCTLSPAVQAILLCYTGTLGTKSLSNFNSSSGCKVI